jgi:predicted nucleic acid-binding protein
MAGELYLIDSNVLIRWVQHESPDFSVVRTAIKQLSRFKHVPCYTSQNLGEFWNVLTRPADRNGYGYTPAAAHIRAADIESNLRLLPDTLAVHNVWRRLLVDYRVCGVQVHDARLVAAMRVHGVERILTFNTKDFARFDQIQAIHPRDLAA